MRWEAGVLFSHVFTCLQGLSHLHYSGIVGWRQFSSGVIHFRLYIIYRTTLEVEDSLKMLYFDIYYIISFFFVVDKERVNRNSEIFQQAPPTPTDLLV